MSLSLSFCWSGHVSSPLWSNVSMVKSPKNHSLKVFSSLWSNASIVKSHTDRSLEVFSKYICHCHCLFSLYFCWSGQVSSPLCIPVDVNFSPTGWILKVILFWESSLPCRPPCRRPCQPSCPSSCQPPGQPPSTPISLARFRFGLECRKALNPIQWVSQWVSKVGLELLGQLKTEKYSSLQNIMSPFL